MLRRLQALAIQASDDDLRVLLMNRKLLVDESKVMVMGEFGLSVASGVFVVCYLAIHLRSPIVALLGMLQTIVAFPLAFFLYRVVFQVTFFASMNLLSIFIILGISADDIFVFYDAWRQSKTLISNTND